MKEFLISSLLILSIESSFAGLKNDQKEIWINILSVEVSDYDTFELQNKIGNKFRLFCSNNPFYRNKHSYLEYENIYGIHVKDFTFKDDLTCHFFKNFMNSVFPAINEKNSIRIKLNRSTGRVDKILLPDLDPWENGDNYYNESEDNNLKDELATR